MNKYMHKRMNEIKRYNAVTDKLCDFGEVALPFYL